MKHADLFITHGGMNSVNEAIYYGVPMLVMPFINDQPENAEQVERLKLGKKTSALFATAADLYRQAMDVLSDREIIEECKNMQREIKSGSTIDDIIDMIERIIS